MVWSGGGRGDTIMTGWLCRGLVSRGGPGDGLATLCSKRRVCCCVFLSLILIYLFRFLLYLFFPSPILPPSHQATSTAWAPMRASIVPVLWPLTPRATSTWPTRATMYLIFAHLLFNSFYALLAFSSSVFPLFSFGQMRLFFVHSSFVVREIISIVRGFAMILNLHEWHGGI